MIVSRIALLGTLLGVFPLTAAAAAAAPPVPAQADPSAEAGKPSVPTSIGGLREGEHGPASASQILLQARGHYDNAWQRRGAGELAAGLSEVERCLELLSELGSEGLNAGEMRELGEMRARATGLRDAISGDIADGHPKHDASADPYDVPANGEIDVQLNRDVVRYINYFTGAGRPTFERWLRRSGRYMDMFRRILEQEGLPSDLVHLVFVESGFNLEARSVSAAVGPWQFLRSTGRLFGLTVNQWVDERRDPEKATVAAARYLKHLYQIFGDWPLALASYNAGEGTVLRAIRRQGTNDYWKLRLPKQTEDYVPQFMAVVTIMREPERYGFHEVERDAPMDFDEITLIGPVDLRGLAKVAKVDFQALRKLNPSVLNHTAVGRYQATTVRVPRGTGEEILRQLHSGDASLPAASITVKHRVRRGETLNRIAGLYGVSVKGLARANRISSQKPLRAGMVLTVPGNLAAASPKPVPFDFYGPVPDGSVVPLRRNAYAVSLQVSPIQRHQLGDTTIGSTRLVIVPDRPRTIRVRRGETLASIARREGVSVSELKRVNGLRSTSLRRGMRLRVPAPAAVTAPLADDAVQRLTSGEPVSAAGLAPSAVPESRGGYTVYVRRGDTLGAIARRHGTTVSALMRANGLKSPHSLRAGMTLKIPEA
jgi:membrane-bound lytic murein transglycosylase D